MSYFECQELQNLGDLTDVSEETSLINLLGEVSEICKSALFKMSLRRCMRCLKDASEMYSCRLDNLQLQLAFYQQRKYTRVMFMSIVLSMRLWTVQHLLLFTLWSSPFLILYTSLIFLFPTKTFYKKADPLI